MKKVSGLLLCLLLFVSCKKEREVSRSFYYWNTVFKLTAEESLLLKNTESKRIYLRCFDVDWDKQALSAFPVAPVVFKSAIPSWMELVPVIYITNATLLNSDEKDIPALAEKISNKLKFVVKGQMVSNELQLDCDWTIKTRDKYFALIDEIRKHQQKGILLSATIRLHQIKYYLQTGIPPVDRGMLMYYNMGKLDRMESANSIYNDKDAAAYVSSVSSYPLKLDAALPAFSWGVQFRNGKICGLINNVTTAEIRNSGLFKEYDPTHFKSINGNFFQGSYFRKGDQLRMEEIDPETCLHAAEQLSPFLKDDTINLAFYQFGSASKCNYEASDFKAISAVFN